MHVSYNEYILVVVSWCDAICTIYKMFDSCFPQAQMDIESDSTFLYFANPTDTFLGLNLKFNLCPT